MLSDATLGLLLRDFAPGMAVSCNSSDDARAGADATDAIVNFIRHVEISGMVQRDAARVDSCFACRAAVAAVALQARPRKHIDQPGASIDPPDGIGKAFDEEEIALRVSGDIQKVADAGTEGGPTVAGRDLCSIPRNGSDGAGPETNTADPGVVGIGNKQGFAGIKGKGGRPIEKGGRRRAAIA